MNYARYGATRAMFHQGTTGSLMLRGPMVAYDVDKGDGGGGGSEGNSEDNDEDNDDAAAAAAAATAAAEAETARVAAEAEAARIAAGKPKPTDEEAKLLKDAMKHKKAAATAAAALATATAALEAYKGIDPAKVAALMEAEATAEREAAEKRGEYDRILAQVKEQHETQLATLTATVTERDNSLAAAMAQIDDLTVGADFGNSKFLSEKTVLSPKKARQLYGAHFDRVDGATVAYDKPKGAANRTPLVDANGDQLSFEAAIEKIVTTDEDFDRIARSKLKPGSASQGAQYKADESGDVKTEVSGTSRIAAGLAKLPAMK